MSTPEFNNATDLSKHQPGVDPALFEERAALPASIVGNWVNVNAASRGLVRITLQAGPTGLTVHAYGSCSPTPCDWGVAPARAYSAGVDAKPAEAFTAVYKQGFKESILTGQLERGMLAVDNFSTFLDGSSRNDYHSRDYFRRG